MISDSDATVLINELYEVLVNTHVVDPSDSDDEYAAKAIIGMMMLGPHPSRVARIANIPKETMTQMWKNLRASGYFRPRVGNPQQWKYYHPADFALAVLVARGICYIDRAIVNHRHIERSSRRRECEKEEAV